MKIYLDNFEVLETPINPHIKHLEDTIKTTRSIQYDAQIGTIKIRGEIPLFPLFYSISNVTLNKTKSIDLDLSAIDLTQEMFNCVKLEGLDINEIFSIEQLLLSYFYITENNILNELKNIKNHCNYNDLAISGMEERDKVLKYKIGRDSPLKENTSLKKLIQNKNVLRLDGNKMLSEMQLLHILENIDLRGIEYIEEPFKDVNTWNSFVTNNDRYKNLEFALDESFHEYKNQIDKILNLKTIIIKPSRDLAISGLIKLSHEAPDKSIVISSSFENEISLNTLIYLGSLFENHHGLGTFEYMKDSFPRITTDRNKQLIQGYPLALNQIQT